MRVYIIILILFLYSCSSDGCKYDQGILDFGLSYNLRQDHHSAEEKAEYQRIYDEKSKEACYKYD